MADYTILGTEISTDPLVRGYAGMSNQEIVTSLNTVNRDHWIPLTSADVFEAIDPVEFTALSTANRARVDRILGLGVGIRTTPESQARRELVSVFNAGSTTIATLAQLANPKQSRGQEIGWGVVTIEDVNRVRVEP